MDVGVGGTCNFIKKQRDNGFIEIVRDRLQRGCYCFPYLQDDRCHQEADGEDPEDDDPRGRNHTASRAPGNVL